jgi:hypothetical protein
MIESDSPGWEGPGVSLFSGDTHSRSVLKAISWRTLGTLDTFVISWFLTGKVGLAGSIAVLELRPKSCGITCMSACGLPPPGDDANYGDNPWPHPDDER